MAKYTVTGTCEIAGVPPGGTVELDPDVTNVNALFVGGHIEPIEESPRKGGRVRSTPTLVGESGPEDFVPPRAED